ncbi:MAG: hypothetical protein EAZ81_13240 [Verrucomicrobia bacterium]|nr:MAG: hypothetical protein EAZ81_13240 [Verrucomicrobiota bacterium]
MSRWCSTTELTALLFAAGRRARGNPFFQEFFSLVDPRGQRRAQQAAAGEEIEDGKTAKACSRFGHERSEVARRAEGAGGAPESTWEMVSHEGTKARRHEGGKMGDRRWGGILNFGFWILNGEMEVGRAGGGFS